MSNGGGPPPPGGAPSEAAPRLLAWPNPWWGAVRVDMAAAAGPAGTPDSPGLPVEYTIVDAGGRLVARAITPDAAWRWDGRAASGARLPAGRYFVRARRGGAQAHLTLTRIR